VLSAETPVALADAKIKAALDDRYASMKNMLWAKFNMRSREEQELELQMRVQESEIYDRVTWISKLWDDRIMLDLDTNATDKAGESTTYRAVFYEDLNHGNKHPLAQCPPVVIDKNIYDVCFREHVNMVARQERLACRRQLPIQKRHAKAEYICEQLMHLLRNMPLPPDYFDETVASVLRWYSDFELLVEEVDAGLHATVRRPSDIRNRKSRVVHRPWKYMTPSQYEAHPEALEWSQCIEMRTKPYSFDLMQGKKPLLQRYAPHARKVVGGPHTGFHAILP